MLRMLSAIIMLSAAAALAFSETPDSTGRAVGLDSLARKVDSLEASLVLLKLATKDHGIYAIGDGLDWGKGWGFNWQFSEAGYAMEGCYTFGAFGRDKPRFQGNFHSFGLAAGAEFWQQGNPYLETRDSLYSRLLVPYVAVRASTPVLLNFTNFDAGLRVFWSMIDETPKPGVSVFEEMHFWMTKGGHFNLGFSLDSDMRLRPSESKTWSFRPYAGFSMLFGARGDKTIRIAK